MTMFPGITNCLHYPNGDGECLICPPKDKQLAFYEYAAKAVHGSDCLDPPLILWDKITQRNCVVLDCFSSLEFEETTYYQLQQGKSLQPFWRRDDQVEERAIFYGYDAGELCWRYDDKYGKPYTGTAASIKAIYEALILRKADVSHSRSRNGGREIIGREIIEDLSDMIVQAMHWREEGGLGYE